MTQEEKAKAYDKAIERVKVFKEHLLEINEKDYADELNYIFPELKESEDERIREAILESLPKYGYLPQTSIRVEDAIAWLEKQGQKEATWNKEDEENMNNVLYILNQLKDTSSYEEDNIPEKAINWFKSLKERLCSNNEYDKDMLEAIEYCKKNNRPLEKEHLAWLEKQGEQKPPIIDFKAKDLYVSKVDGKIYDMTYNPTDKVGPMFKVGDWIIKNNDSSINIDYSCCKVTKVENGNYTIESIYGYKGYNTFETFEKDYHLWTIQDAKDGDVLACENGWACIFNSLNDNLFSSHCFRDHERWFCEDGGEAHTLDKRICGEIHPATKEQRNLLFSKMHEAGYEWDAEKKELKKIYEDGVEYKKHIMSELVNLATDYVKQKSEPAWSEEDEKNWQGIIDEIQANKNSAPCYDLETYDRYLNWIESIKQRLGGGK